MKQRDFIIMGITVNLPDKVLMMVNKIIVGVAFLLILTISFMTIYALNNNRPSDVPEGVIAEQTTVLSLNQTMVVFTFDDGRRSDYTTVYPMMQSKGFQSTHYIVPINIDREDYVMTWDQIKEMNDSGFDIQCHTYSHANLQEINATEIENELVAVNKAFMEHGLPTPKHISYPYSSNPVNNTVVITKYRLTGRQVNAFENNYLSSTNYDELYSLSSYPIEYSNNTEPLDKAIEGNYTLIYCLHAVIEDPGAYDINVSEFEKVLDYVEEKNVPVVTMSELYEIMESEGLTSNFSTLDNSLDEEKVGVVTSNTTLNTTLNNLSIPGLNVTIISHLNGSTVSFKENITGNSTGVYNSGMHLYVMANPITTPGVWWLQNEAAVGPDGTWHANVQFGISIQEYIGEQYWVTSVLSSEPISAEEHDYPKNTTFSTEKILLTRV